RLQWPLSNPQERERHDGYDTANFHHRAPEGVGRRASPAPVLSATKRGRATLFHCWRQFMVSIQLPAGSRREFPGPVTVEEVAASIRPGLAEAGLRGRLGTGEQSRRVDASYRIDHDERLAIVTDKDPDG